MNRIIKTAYENGRLVLFFGAGASVTSVSADGKQLPLGNQLAERLAVLAGFEYRGEDLSSVYSAVRGTLGSQKVLGTFGQTFRNCRPSKEYEGIAKYPYARIYTLNIDDALEAALKRNSPQEIYIHGRKDPILDQDQIYSRLDVIHLNGHASRPTDGFIFSGREYAAETAHESPWYKQLAADYFKYCFLFIGTRLNESAFEHHIEKLRHSSQSQEPTHYLLTRNATPIEAQAWKEYGIEHIQGSFDDFNVWLQANFSKPPSTLTIAVASNPPLGQMLKLAKEADRHSYAESLSTVFPINRESILRLGERPIKQGEVSEFYRGFKPKWNEVVEGVPAWLEASHAFRKILSETNLETHKRLFVVVGPAGSGKTTLLKQIALSIADNERVPCYYVDDTVSDIKDVLYKLEQAHKSKYFVFIERINMHAKDLAYVFERNPPKYGFVVGNERLSIWDARTSAHLLPYIHHLHRLDKISRLDAKNILEKLEKYGPWTRLVKMNAEERLTELYEKSQRQLLIGLLETTTGEGYVDLIRAEYAQLSDHTLKQMLLLIGVATINRFHVSDSHVSRALQFMGLDANVKKHIRNMAGIVVENHGLLTVRHPTYAAELFDKIVGSEGLTSVLKAFLQSYTTYEAPVVTSIGKKDARLFKAVINHRFIERVLKKNLGFVTEVYQSLEKPFERDGLFWLQYGLAMRSFSQHERALRYLRTAVEAYPQDHTRHAYAQQQFIMAAKTDDKATAESLIQEATVTLGELENTIHSDDTYPLVTLAEEHTKAVRHLYGDEDARKVANGYLEVLSKRRNEAPRVNQAYELLFRYVSVGVWKEADFEEYLF